MARRKVIADSEDEDDGDDGLLLQSGGDFDRPEPEPLSPQHRPSSPAAVISKHHDQPSSVTDPSFFADVYDNQQSLAAQQSHLVEQIVQQSQRASASSGDVSLPANKRQRANPSSGTDVTSPMVLSKPLNHTAPFPDDASEFTTPRKSTGQEWEIPSSPEDRAASHRTKCLAGKEKARSERKRGKARLVSSPAAAVSAAEEPIPKAPFEDVVENQEVEGLIAGGMSTLPENLELSHHDSILPDTTKFYIAQSNLTTMQKLEYQQVNVSNSYGGLPGCLPNQKSSGATTIAYSTPSGYSSIPPLPWEEPPAQSASPQRNEVIDINSSPDIVDSGFDLPNESVAIADIGIEIPMPSKGCESPVMPQSRTPISKGRKRTRQIAEEDELCQDNTWGLDDIDVPQESYTSRDAKRRSVVARGFVGVKNNMDNLENVSNEPMVPTQSTPKLPASALPDTDPFEPPPEALPRKRGRKRKQPAIDIPPTPTVLNEDSHLNQNSTSSNKAAAVEPSLETPKKKRGRPRKSELLKAAEEQLPETPIAGEQPRTDLPQKDNNSDKSAPVITEQKDGGHRTKGKKSEATEDHKNADSKENRLPLKEVDSNPKTLAKSASIMDSPTKAKTEVGDEKSTPKTQMKETPKPGALQSKVTYRVGLSKRSRIAPLLKSIRK
ncbi:hypothetical protein F5Y12DRAFT_361877 [Xylaria sp. FL1777]|nr:hypothetical protein F5Y12DRAFT_361877 [Xylaria sp. FL1777]